MAWSAVPIPASAESLAAVEKLCACPILSAPKLQAEEAAAEEVALKADAVRALTILAQRQADTVAAAQAKAAAEKAKKNGGAAPPAAPPAKVDAAAVEGAAEEMVARAKLSVREWYLEAADAEPPEEPLVREAVDKIRAMRRFEESCGAFLGDVRHIMTLLNTIEAQHQQVRVSAEWPSRSKSDSLPVGHCIARRIGRSGFPPRSSSSTPFVFVVFPIVRTHTLRVTISWQTRFPSYSARVATDQPTNQPTTQVWAKTTGLNMTCERLLAEQQLLRAQVEQIRAPLEHFNELERIGPLLGVPVNIAADLAAMEGNGSGAQSASSMDLTTNIAPSSIKVHPGSDQFLDVLRRIEANLTYFDRHVSRPSEMENSSIVWMAIALLSRQCD